MGGFNAEPSDTSLSDFCEIYDLICFNMIYNLTKIRFVLKIQTNRAVLNWLQTDQNIFEILKVHSQVWDNFWQMKAL